MKITKTPLGYLIEPVTSDQEKALKVLLQGLEQLTNGKPATAGCVCRTCHGGVAHMSSCAVHNGPALEPGPCDCGAEGVEGVREGAMSPVGVGLIGESGPNPRTRA